MTSKVFVAAVPQVLGIQWAGSNLGELQAFCGQRNVETLASPYLVQNFNLEGTYTLRRNRDNLVGELYLPRIHAFVPVQVGDWVVRVVEVGLQVLPSNEDGTAPVNYVPETLSGVGTTDIKTKDLEHLLEVLENYRTTLLAAMQPFLKD